ncbi:MAG: shikimate kinase [Planctomycetes bacterium]|nr:shikimate kinase [Planctomycetota bacterium]
MARRERDLASRERKRPESARPESAGFTPVADAPGSPRANLRLFLIGYRGAGKTAVAPLVAKKLGWSWCDADQVFEESCGTTINDIFRTDGEARFREIESQVLDDLCKLERQVIATGGGVVLRPENRKSLRAGRVVWLMADAETLRQRTEQDAATHRPNLAQGGLDEIEEMLRIRTPLYAECAELTVDTRQITPERIAEKIAQWILKP